MLAKQHRITDGADYRRVVRRGARRASTHTVTYAMRGTEASAPRFGFIVSKQIGSAVVRNQVRRRLKAACYELLPSIPAGSDVVIRALPPAATTDFATLQREVARALTKIAT